MHINIFLRLNMEDLDDQIEVAATRLVFVKYG
jgi:hypothetical protein